MLHLNTYAIGLVWPALMHFFSLYAKLIFFYRLHLWEKKSTLQSALYNTKTTASFFCCCCAFILKPAEHSDLACCWTCNQITPPPLTLGYFVSGSIRTHLFSLSRSAAHPPSTFSFWSFWLRSHNFAHTQPFLLSSLSSWEPVAMECTRRGDDEQRIERMWDWDGELGVTEGCFP